ncbi:MAG: M23 family peptidase, partial [Bacteroidota bacterium]|nr:M23 family peptidase [Bacteroidota bacterium]
MPKYKYYYDQETLSYRRIEVNTGVRFRNAIVFLTVSALFGLIMLLVLLSSPLIETPKEIAQAREIDNYQLQYEQLNRKMQQIE